MSSRQEKYLKSAHDRSETLTKQSLLSLDDYPVKINPLLEKQFIANVFVHPPYKSLFVL